MNIGIDVGGTNIKAGIVDDGKIILKHSVPTPLDSEANFRKALIETTEFLINNSPIDTEISSIGIGAPGIVDRNSASLIYSDKIPYGKLCARELLGKKYNLEVYVENDANCAALGEFYASDGEKDFVFITLGTGVGGGIIIDGKLYTGKNGAAAEIGHMTTHAGGRKCSCKRQGCFEAYASVTALVNFTKEVKDKLDKKYSSINGRTAFEEAEKGNPAALMVRDRWIKEVGVGVANVVNIFQPEEIVIGGAISKEGDVLLNPIRRYVSQNDYSASLPELSKTKINLSRTGEDAGIIGASFLEKNYKEQVIG